MSPAKGKGTRHPWLVQCLPAFHGGGLIAAASATPLVPRFVASRLPEIKPCSQAHGRQAGLEPWQNALGDSGRLLRVAIHGNLLTFFCSHPWLLRGFAPWISCDSLSQKYAGVFCASTRSRLRLVKDAGRQKAAQPGQCHPWPCPTKKGMHPACLLKLASGLTNAAPLNQVKLFYSVR